jgi:hypothetical protein
MSTGRVSRPTQPVRQDDAARRRAPAEFPGALRRLLHRAAQAVRAAHAASVPF